MIPALKGSKKKSWITYTLILPRPLTWRNDIDLGTCATSYCPSVQLPRVAERPSQHSATATGSSDPGASPY